MTDLYEQRNLMPKPTHFWVVETPFEEDNKCWEEIDEEFVKNIAADNFDELSFDQPLVIRKITPLQSVKSKLSGAMMDGCNNTMEAIRYWLDIGLEHWEMEVIKENYLAEFLTAETFTNLVAMQAKSND